MNQVGRSGKAGTIGNGGGFGLTFDDHSSFYSAESWSETGPKDKKEYLSVGKYLVLLGCA